MINLLPSRAPQVCRKISGGAAADIACAKPSVAGSVSQRACVFCGSRVVLYPIADALHLVHGPIGCAAYTWDIRGALSSGPQLHRHSFSTDLQELDVIYGGEKKLEAALLELIAHYRPQAAFVYSTCIVGLIGDDVGAVCQRVAAQTGIPVLPVNSEGFKGTKKDGYRAACEAIYQLVGTGDISAIGPHSINILGDFNLAGETWIIRDYYQKIGIEVVACVTGDARVADIRRCHGAKLNLVQCSGSMTNLARMLEKNHGIPFKRVSYFGIEDMAAALYEAAKFFNDPALLARAQALVRDEIGSIYPQLQAYKAKLAGKKAAIYVGGAFKAFSLMRALRLLGMRTVVVGSQTGDQEDYRQLQEMADPGTIIVDDSNPLELAKFCLEKDVDLFIGGVKERPIAYKLGIGFCDHNHERKEPLAGFIGMLNFAKEVYASVASPVWQLTPRKFEAGETRSGQLGEAVSAPPPSAPGHGPRNADFPVCWGAGFPTRPPPEGPRAADLEVGETAGLETCATSPGACSAGGSVRLRPPHPSAPVPATNSQCAPEPGRDENGEGREEPRSQHFASTRNACKLCTPLGACLAFRGVAGCIPFLHGSQGCATYIRRYLISHFREPMDIASSNFHEESAIFGGGGNFQQGVGNVIAQYQPQLVGVATTCLAETIGEDMKRLFLDFAEANPESRTPLVQVSTASYRGTHIDGFHAAVRAMVEQLAGGGAASFGVNIFPGIVSPADLRHLKEILGDFGLSYHLLPDYSETMDGETWSQYEKLPAGGTPVADIVNMGRGRASVEFGRTLKNTPTAGGVLAGKFGLAHHLLGLPIGVRESDRFFSVLEALAGEPRPPKYQRERGRLVDSFIDGHKHVFEKRAIVYGEEDLVIGLTAFLTEMGVTPVLCASGGKSRRFERCLREAAPALPAETLVKEGFDFAEIAELAPSLKPDFLLGSSKGYQVARKLGVPLVRAGFPIHDRLGGQRILHVGYRGAQELFDRIANALMEVKQETSPVGYSYL